MSILLGNLTLGRRALLLVKANLFQCCTFRLRRFMPYACIMQTQCPAVAARQLCCLSIPRQMHFLPQYPNSAKISPLTLLVYFLASVEWAERAAPGREGGPPDRGEGAAVEGRQDRRGHQEGQHGPPHRLFGRTGEKNFHLQLICERAGKRAHTTIS